MPNGTYGGVRGGLVSTYSIYSINFTEFSSNGVLNFKYGSAVFLN